jgi:hypothetical protein
MAKNNGRAPGQIRLSKTVSQRGFNANPNAVQTVGLRGARKQPLVNGKTKLAKSVNISGGLMIKNSNSKNAPSANTGQTVGLKGAKVGYVNKGSRVADSVPDRMSRNTRTFNPMVAPTIGLAKAGKPPIQTARTRSNFQRQSPHAINTVGLRGAKAGVNRGPRSGSKLSKGAGDKNSQNPYVTPPHANETQGIKHPRKQTGAVRTRLKSSGTGKTPQGSGRGIPAKTGRRQVISSLRPQKSFVSGIPAQIRRAASRAPSNGSLRPSFTTKVVKITSK